MTAILLLRLHGRIKAASNYRPLSTHPPFTPSSFVQRCHAMSTTSGPKLHQFLVFAPDKTDEGAFQRRLSVRDSHLGKAKKMTEAGKIKLGGAMLSPESIATPDAPKKMVGSTMIYEAETLQEVEDIVKGDIYYTTGVWDPEKIVILPFAAAPLSSA